MHFSKMKEINEKKKNRTKRIGSRCMYFVCRRWRPGRSHLSVSSWGISTALPSGSSLAASSGPAGLPPVTYSKHKQERKSGGVNISSEHGRGSGGVCSFYVHPHRSIRRARTQKEARARKGKSESLHRQTHCAKRLSSSISVRPTVRREQETCCIIILIPSDHEILCPRHKSGTLKKKKHVTTRTGDDQISQRHL